jgi:SAM-dependent methyltransferase
MRCGACALVWLGDDLTVADFAAAYGSEYDAAIAEAGKKPSHWEERRRTLLRYRDGGGLLDLGCGSGAFLAQMKSASWTLTGIEMSSAAASQARDRSGADVFEGDIVRAPFARESFDAITCFHVFEHLVDPVAVLKKVACWLRPGGVFYSMMPNIESVGASIFGSHWYALELPRHLYHFSPKSLRVAAKVVGLREVSLVTRRELFIEPSIRYVVDSARRWLGGHPQPLANAKERRLAWRVVRKGLRAAVWPAVSALATPFGDGESIHVILKKDG